MTPEAQNAILQALLSQCLLSILLAALLWALASRQRGDAFFRLWTSGWTWYAVYLAASALSLTLVSILPAGSAPVRFALRVIAVVASGLHAAFLVTGVRRLADRPGASVSPASQRILLAIGGGTMFVAVIAASQLQDPMLGVAVRSLPRLLLDVTAYAWCAVAIWTYRERVGRWAALVLTWTMALWAMEQGFFALGSLKTLAASAGWSTALLPLITTQVGTWLTLLDLLWLSSVATGVMLMILAASDRDRQELGRATTAYRTLVESSPSAIIVVGADGRVDLVNQAAHHLFGWPSDTAALTPPDIRARPEDESPWQQALTGQRLTGLVGEIARADGATIVVSLAVAPLLAEDGAVQGAVGVATDLTGLRRLEADLRHAQKMEAVGRLAGGIAHDFNNLLTAMLGSLHLLEDEIAADHPANTTVEEIREAANRAADLTSRLLGFSRREPRAPSPLSLDVLVADLGKLLRRMVDDDVLLELDLNGSLPPVVADPGELEQVVTNLCINARDAMQESGGSIVIRTSQLDVSFPLSGLLAPPGPGRFVRLDVADTGAGMDAATLGRMFEPFYTTKQPGKGTGLGLATVYAILEEMGGQLRVESAEGVGTTFSLFLRAA